MKVEKSLTTPMKSSKLNEEDSVSKYRTADKSTDSKSIINKSIEKEIEEVDEEEEEEDDMSLKIVSEIHEESDVD